jgi:SAM-dependent methyltransferase
VSAYYDDPFIAEAYDAFYRGNLQQIDCDVEIYGEHAERSGGAVLEVACGTGRITLPLVERGLEVTGVDLSAAMLARAKAKAAPLPEARRNCLSLVQQDMSALELGRRFRFAFVPFRSFQHLLTPDLQRRALLAIRLHLEPGGSLALHLFDPRLDFLIDDTPLPVGLSGTSFTTGRRYECEVLKTRFDHLAQIRYDLWHYRERSQSGALMRQEKREMALRWTWRWELRHLLELCGFTVEAEYSDFRGAPPAYGKELIVVARA